MLDLKSLIPWRKHHEIPVHKAHSGRSPAPQDDAHPATSNGNALSAFRDGFEHLLDDFLTAVTGHEESDFLPASQSRSASQAHQEATNWRWGMPTVDVIDGEKQLTITAELPGVSERDVDVTISGEVLTIRGEKKYDHEEKDGDRYYVERRYGSFSRAIRLPFNAEDLETQAAFDKGVLTISIAKPKDLKSTVKHIEVRAH